MTALRLKPIDGKIECTFSMASAVFTGTVDFSTTILLLLATLAIMRAAPSQYVRSAALPAPTPLVFVGVFTLQVMRRSISRTIERCLLRIYHSYG